VGEKITHFSSLERDAVGFAGPISNLKGVFLWVQDENGELKQDQIDQSQISDSP
jgi:hypothetical protein